mgnify:CR=1 FL=1
MSTNITASFDPSLATVAGIITYWSGSSGVRVPELDAALKARGLDLAPGPAKPAATAPAIRRYRSAQTRPGSAPTGRSVC